jgi:hypothetical protein
VIKDDSRAVRGDNFTTNAQGKSACWLGAKRRDGNKSAADSPITRCECERASKRRSSWHKRGDKGVDLSLYQRAPSRLEIDRAEGAWKNERLNGDPYISSDAWRLISKRESRPLSARLMKHECASCSPNVRRSPTLTVIGDLSSEEESERARSNVGDRCRADPRDFGTLIN